MLTLTHTYPLENKFVNPETWKSEEFQKNHHKHWGKLYRPEEVHVSAVGILVSWALKLFPDRLARP